MNIITELDLRFFNQFYAIDAAMPGLSKRTKLRPAHHIHNVIDI